MCRCAVQLWTLWGDCIGMFGQPKPWNVRQPSTWSGGAPHLPRSTGTVKWGHSREFVATSVLHIAPQSLTLSVRSGSSPLKANASGKQGLAIDPRRRRGGHRQPQPSPRTTVARAASSGAAALAQRAVSGQSKASARGTLTAFGSGSSFGAEFVQEVGSGSDSDSTSEAPTAPFSSRVHHAEGRPDSPAVMAGLVPPPRAETSSSRLNTLLRIHDATQAMQEQRPSWMHLRKKNFVPSWRNRRRNSLPDAIPEMLGMGTLATAVTAMLRAAKQAKASINVVPEVSRRRVSHSVAQAARGESPGPGNDDAPLNPALAHLRKKLYRYRQRRCVAGRQQVWVAELCFAGTPRSAP